MNKKISSYIICWVLVLSLFNVLCFVTPNTILGGDKFSGAFWPGYIFITIAFILHLAFSIYCLSKNDKVQTSLNIPLSIIASIGLIVMLVVGGICMLIPFLPSWIGIIACYLILVVTCILTISTKTVTEHTVGANNKLNEKTSNYRDTVAKAQQLLMLSNNDEIKNLLNKLFESIKYSDSISNEKTKSIETEINTKLAALTNQVKETNDVETIKNSVDELLLLVNERNNICKLSK